jgi:hypothetical protein
MKGMQEWECFFLKMGCNIKNKKLPSKLNLQASA